MAMQLVLAIFPNLDSAQLSVKNLQEGGAGPLECVVGPAPDLLLYSVAQAAPWQGDALRLVRRVQHNLNEPGVVEKSA